MIHRLPAGDAGYLEGFVFSDHHYLYGGSYSDQDLHWWADRIAEWEAAGKEVFVYFNNDDGGNAVRNALTLRSFLGSH